MWSNKNCDDFSWRFMQYAFLNNLNILNTRLRVRLRLILYYYSKNNIRCYIHDARYFKKNHKKYFGYDEYLKRFIIKIGLILLHVMLIFIKFLF